MQLIISKPLHPETLKEIQARLSLVCQRASLASGLTFRIQVVMAEVLNNAIEHAGPIPPVVSVTCQQRHGLFSLCIDHATDRLEQLPSDTMPSPLSNRGRGWAIIQQWTDHITFSCHDLGSQLRLDFDLRKMPVNSSN